jgi:ABC-type antimicrobial peptide transport system permease subunit
MRRLAENIGSAVQSLSSNWLRTALTTLGMIVGVGSVALLVSIALGVRKDITEQIQGLGANLVFVVPGKLEKNSAPNALSLLGVSTLTEGDIRELRALPSIDRVAPVLFVGGTADRNGAPQSAFVIATTSDWFQMRPKPLAEGRLFTKAEEYERVCVLAQATRDAMFGSGDAIGETIMVQGMALRVVGVFKA